jgi:hypothetical protein
LIKCLENPEEVQTTLEDIKNQIEDLEGEELFGSDILKTLIGCLIVVVVLATGVLIF